MCGRQLRVSSLPSLRENSISSEGARELARALSINTTLKNLEYVSGGQPGLPTAPSAEGLAYLEPWGWGRGGHTLMALPLYRLGKDQVGEGQPGDGASGGNPCTLTP